MTEQQVYEEELARFNSIGAGKPAAVEWDVAPPPLNEDGSYSVNSDQEEYETLHPSDEELERDAELEDQRPGTLPHIREGMFHCMGCHKKYHTKKMAKKCCNGRILAARGKIQNSTALPKESWLEEDDEDDDSEVENANPHHDPSTGQFTSDHPEVKAAVEDFHKDTRTGLTMPMKDKHLAHVTKMAAGMTDEEFAKHLSNLITVKQKGKKKKLLDQFRSMLERLVVSHAQTQF